MALRILLVDDALTIVALVKVLLGNEFEYLVARDGKSGEQAALEHQPDIVLLDINMPVQDGITTLRHLKQNPRTSRIPVIMMSTESEASHATVCRELGCVDFVSKPLGRSRLVTAIYAALPGSPTDRGA